MHRTGRAFAMRDPKQAQHVRRLIDQEAVRCGAKEAGDKGLLLGSGVLQLIAVAGPEGRKPEMVFEGAASDP